ncbi:XkdF-like putative serine protease domain-containing protein [Enterococcus sp. AZ109]|uniref:XkdF-like putative serine protease domain-containing protein n=1 Tax=Enterococcus sp. AZ109 TaxID=2774634 RepID=UPI003F24810B
MRKLENVKVTHVSYVDKAANKKSFFLTKSEEEPTFQTIVKLVTKADDPQKLVYGVVYEPDAEDAHGDYMDAETIEKAAHNFMEDYQQIDKQHDFTTNAGKVVESYVAPVDMEIGETPITKGTWVLVTKATDEMWEGIQKGEFTGYSLAGTAQVEEVKKQTTDNFNRRKTYRDVNAAIDAFQSATWSILDNYTDSDADKVAGIQKEIEELSALIGTIPTTKSVTKQGLVDTIKSFFSTQNSKEEQEMTQEELQKALGEVLQPIAERLEKLENSKTDEGEELTDEEKKKKEKEEKKKVTKAEAQQFDVEALTKAVQAAVAPLNEKIETLEKARISNNQEPTYQEKIEKSDVPSYVNEVFPISE